MLRFASALGAVNSLANGQATSVGFVTPIVSVCLAAYKIHSQFDASKLTFGEEALGYAENNGLRFYLGLANEKPLGGSLVGRTYCQISKLHLPSEVNACNGVIGSLLYGQLANCPNRSLVSATCSVVGELHDNVASHAQGCGFSAAQVYSGNVHAIQIAVADCGIGLGKKVRRAGLNLDDAEAIYWCLERGNTTARSQGLLGPQRLPEDYRFDPFPENTSDFYGDRNHMGEGLFQLVELIRESGGKVWIWSGKAQVLCSGNSRLTIQNELYWSGTALEIEIPISAFETCPAATSSVDFEILAKRLNL